MALPRTFVSFSSTDIGSYRLMCAWKGHEHIDFNFYDLQLEEAIDSTNEQYIKRVCRGKLNRAGTYILLIGSDTRLKTTYVKWEAEVAIENECRLIGVNLDKYRRVNYATCPSVFNVAGAMFVPFSPQIVAHALANWTTPNPREKNWEYNDGQYQALGYVLNGDTATRLPKPNPFLGGSRPPWAKWAPSALRGPSATDLVRVRSNGPQRWPNLRRQVLQIATYRGLTGMCVARLSLTARRAAAVPRHVVRRVGVDSAGRGNLDC